MKTVRLGDVCNIVSGGTPSRSKTEYWQDGTIPWIKIGNIKGKYVSEADEFITQAGLDSSSAKMLPKGTILYTIFATLGEVGILDFEACTNQAIAGISIRDSSELQPDYLYYYLKSKKSYANGIGRGVAQNNINMSILRDYRVPLPTIERQNEIVSLLDKASTVIALHQKQLAVLDNLIKARFVEMFGDPEAGACPFQTEKLRDLSVKISDGVHAKPDYTETGRPFLSVVNINRGVVDFTDCKFVSEEAYQKMIKSTYPQKGDVLYTKVGATYGIPAYVDTEREFCLYVSVCLIKPAHEKINARFLSLQMAMPSVKHQADARIKGIGVPDLHLNQISEFNIVCPPRNLQDEFVHFVAQVDKSKFVVQKALDKAQLLFDSLMQKYFG